MDQIQKSTNRMLRNLTEKTETTLEMFVTGIDNGTLTPKRCSQIMKLVSGAMDSVALIRREIINAC